MGNHLRYIILFLAVLLSFTGISKHAESALSALGGNAPAHVSISDALSQGQSFHLTLYQGEYSGNTTPPFPVRKLQDHPGGCARMAAWQAQAQQRFGFNISNSKYNPRCLSVRDIIFPFHYFW